MTRDKQLFLSAVLVAVVSSPAARATDYWVDGLDGSDANDGLTIPTAKGTIDGALSVATAGDIVHVLPGEYNQAFTFPSTADGVTLTGEGEVVIAASPNSAQGRLDIVIKNLTFRNAGVQLQGSSGALVENCRFLPGGLGDGSTGAAGPWTARSCAFSGVDTLAFSLRGPGGLVENCTFYNCALALRTASDTLVVRNNSFVQNGTAIEFEGPANEELFPVFCNFFGNTADTSDNVTLSNSVFADPLFIDPANDVFYVQAGSPLLDQGEDGGPIGAFGQGFHSSKDESPTPWSGWIDSNGDVLSASSLVELNDLNEVVLAIGTTSAAIYSPVFDTGSQFTVIRSVDFAAFEDTTLPAGSRKIIDAVQATPKREVNIRTSLTSFAQDPSSGPAWEAVDKRMRFEKRAQYVQMELVLRSDGD